MFKGLFFAMLLFAHAYTVAAAEPLRWIAYYSDKAEPQNFQPYSVIVFDVDDHPMMQGLLENGKTVLGYLSLGDL